jgi:molybdate transport system substrate-binding protein
MANLRTTAGATAIKVLASGAVSWVMSELALLFERSRGHKLLISRASSNMVASRIKGGETADLVILSASAIDELEQSGKVVAGSRTDLATSSIGVAVRAGSPRPDINSVEDFTRFLLNAKSVAYTTTGASGVHFRGVIEHLGISGAITAKARVLTSGLVGELVAQGEAEVGIQMISEIMAVSGAELLGPLPPELQCVLMISAGLLVEARQQDAARTLIKFLSTPAAKRMFKAKGLEPCGARKA